jgi:hypothetical protein
MQFVYTEPVKQTSSEFSTAWRKKLFPFDSQTNIRVFGDCVQSGFGPGVSISGITKEGPEVVVPVAPGPGHFCPFWVYSITFVRWFRWGDSTFVLYSGTSSVFGGLTGIILLHCSRTAME